MAVNVVTESLPATALDSRYRIGAWVSVASIAMLFTALSSAYVVRAASAPDWQALSVPRALWASGALLLISSVTMQHARSYLRRYLPGGYVRYLVITGLLGLGFLTSQIVAWRELARQGIYLATNPHSSFFYLLTATHGLHLLGGLLFIALLILRAAIRGGDRIVDAKGLGFTEAATIYWHFLDALWLYLFVLLFVWHSV